MKITDNKITNTTNFQGRNISKRIIKRDITSYAARVLGENRREILKLTKHSSKKRLYFLDDLVLFYNRINFHRPENEQEPVSLVTDIYKKVKRPKLLHFKLLDNFIGNVESFDRIITGIDGKQSRLKFVDDIKQAFDNERSGVHEKITEELLTSKHVKEYVKHSKKYLPYLMLNKDNPEVVKNLDEMVSNKTYNAEKYTKELQNKTIIEKCPLDEFSSAFTLQDYFENYTKNRFKVLNKLKNTLILKDNKNSLENKAIMLDIYKSTNDENGSIRTNLLEHLHFTNHNLQDSENYNELLNSTQNVFNKIDSDKHVKNFVKYILKNKIRVQNMNELNKIIESVPSLKLDVFKKNIGEIININSRQKAQDTDIQIIENYDNQFYKHIYYDIDLSAFGVFRLNTINTLNKLKYKLLNNEKNIQPNIVSEIIESMPQPSDKTNSKIPVIASEILSETKPEDDEIFLLDYIPEFEFKPKKKFEFNIPAQKPKETKLLEFFPQKKQEIVEEAQKANSEPKETKLFEFFSPQNKFEFNIPAQKPKETKLLEFFPQKKQNVEEIAEKPVSQAKTEKTKNSVSESRKARAEKTKQDVLEIITSKLGIKTQERQKDLFGAQATKIRLSLLPEIFASIADTRKTDRMVGKRKINSSNKDALDLYLLISGNNRKFVNYLLKKRNIDGTRMFEVKDIISMVKAAEAKIEQDKKANPAYRANDARKYYNHLYESKIQQYGKITKSRRA